MLVLKVSRGVRMLSASTQRFARQFAGMNAFCLAGLAALTLSPLVGTRLAAQTAHPIGAVATLSVGFNYPGGVAVDASGNVFVADFYDNAVKEIMAAGGYTTVNTVGSGFSNPYAVAVDASGNVFVADFSHNAIKEIVAAGGYTTVVTLGSGFSHPSGVAVDGSGNVFVGDFGNNAVKEILAAGGYTTVLTLGSGFSFPEGVAVDASDNVFVADTLNSAVKEIVAAGGYTAVLTLGSGFSYPGGVALDASGNLYVADSGNDAVEELPAATGYSTVNIIGGGFNEPASVAADGHGNVMVADSGNNAVEEILAGGSFGPVNVGSPVSHPAAVYFTFDTGGVLGSTAVLTQGAAGLDFTDAGGGSCTVGFVYYPGDICAVNVTFKPRAPGVRLGAAELFDSSGNPIATGYVSGIGEGPQVNYPPGAQSVLGSGFAYPYGVAVDASGNVFVADLGSHLVKEMVAVGGRIPPSPSIRTLGGGFSGPTGVAVDGAGNVFVADYYGSAVKEIVAAGGYTTVNTLGSGFIDPPGVAVDGSGNVFVADGGHHVVREMMAAGGYTTSQQWDIGFRFPWGVAVDESGNVFVADEDAHAVYELLAVGGSLPNYPAVNVLGSGFTYPFGVAVDANSNVFVADEALTAVMEIVEASGYTTVNALGSGFYDASGVAVDGNGNVFVADVSNSRVVRLDYTAPPRLKVDHTFVGSTSTDSPQTVEIANSGNQPLNFLSVSYPTDFPEFGSDPNTCAASTSLIPGQQCDLPISFAPLSAASLSENVILTDNALNAAAATQSIHVTGTGEAVVPTYFSVSAAGPFIAGSPFTITVTALSSTNHVATGYHGTVSFSSSDPAYAGPATLTLANGTGQATVTLKTAGTQTIVAMDTVMSLSGAGGFEVIPGPASSLQIAVPASASYVAPINFAVTAYDLYGNVATGFGGTLVFSSSDPNATLPAPSTLTNGTGTFAATLATAGTQTITATDAADSLTFTSSAITVNAPTTGNNFGPVDVGTPSVSPITLVLTFGAGGTLGSTAVLTQGATGLDFTDAGGGTCAPSTAYNAGDACTVNVTFKPTAPGVRYGAAELLDGTGNPLATSYIHGTGLGPQVNFLPGTQSTLGSGFNRPEGVAVDGNGNVFVTDQVLGAVKEIVAARGYTTINTIAGGFSQPLGIAVDGSGNLFVADYGLGAVMEIVAAGGYTTVNTLINGLNGPTGVAVDTSGNVYFTAIYDSNLREMLAVNGSIPASPTVLTLGSGLHYPYSVAVDTSGNVYFTDDADANTEVKEIVAVNGSIPASPVINNLGSGFDNPYGLSIDGNGNIFVADTFNNAIKEIVAVNGVIPASPTIKTLGSGFSYPSDVVADGRGNIYVADYQNGRVEMLNYADPQSLAFANTNVGSTSADSPQTVGVTNIGNRALTFTGIGYPADFFQSAGDPNACSNSTSLNPGQQCDVPIAFSPLNAGPLSENVTLTDNSLNAAASMQSIPVSGTGEATVPAYFTVTPQAPAVAGFPAPATVTAMSTANTIAGGFSGTVTFTSSDPLFINPGTLTVSNGTGQTALIFGTAGPQTVMVIDTTFGKSGTGVFPVNPGPAASFQIVVPASAVSGTPFNFTVTAYDQFGNLATNDGDAVAFSSTDPRPTLPAPSTLTNGTGTLSATLATPGTQTITVSDSSSGVTNTSAGIAVTAPNLVVTTANDDAGAAANCTPQTTPGTGTDGSCSLRDALQYAANAGAANISFDSIAFAASNTPAQNTITLSNSTLIIPSNAIINGPTTGTGATLMNLVTVDGANSNTVFTVNSGVTGDSLKGLAIIHGYGYSSTGGGISNSGTLTVSNCTFSGNGAYGFWSGGGGGILNLGTLIVSNSTFSGNTAPRTFADVDGGGILNFGTLIVSGSTFSGNSAFRGGGIANLYGTLTVSDSTFYGNTAAGSGGGIDNQYGTLTVSDSTFYGNTAAGSGGGIDNQYGTLTVSGSTFYGNSAAAGGGSIWNDSTQSALVSNSIFSGNHGGAMISVPRLSDIKGQDRFFLDANFNVFYNNALATGGEFDCANCASNNNAIYGDPMLAPLANYGGTTQTMPPLPGSAAICAGSAAVAAGQTTDQRGLPFDALCPAGQVDSGAVQTNYALAFSIEPPSSVPTGQVITPAPAVELMESGAPATAASGSIGMTDSAALLGGTNSASLASGLASFSNLVITSPTVNDTLTATLALTPSLNLTAASTPVSAVGQVQTVTFNPPATSHYGAAAINLAHYASASSGLVVGFQVISGPASVTGTMLNINGAGPIVVAAGQAGNSTYAPAPSVQRTITVSQAFLKLTAHNVNLAYGVALPNPFTFSVTGYVNGDTAATAFTGTPSMIVTAVQGSPVGTYPISPSIGSLTSANYTFQFTAGTLTIKPAVLKVIASSYSVVYGAALPATLAYTVTGYVNGDTAATAFTGAPILTTTAVQGAQVGIYPITLTAGTLASTNYTFAFTNGKVTITHAVLKVIASSYSAVYGDVLPSLAYTVTGYVNGDTAANAYTGAPTIVTAAVQGSPAGTYPITVTVGTLSSVNYTFQFTNGKVTIARAVLNVTASDASKVYGAALPTPYAYTVSGYVNGDTAAMAYTGAPHIVTTAVVKSPVGTYPITPAKGTLVSTNYSFQFAAGTLTITPAVLTVTAHSYTITFGTALPAFAYSVTGYVAGDTAATAFTGVPSINTMAIQGSPVGTYPITPAIGSLASTNYTFVLVNGTLTITP